MLINNRVRDEEKEFLNILKNYQKINLQKVKKEADNLRKKQVGDKVTYVINRNINFTNICEQHCSFCAFRRDANDKGVFWLDIETILRKCQEAINLNATEICMQGGLNPQAQIQGSSLKYYLQLIKSIKKEFSQLHLHAFSPQEIEFIARQDNLSFSDVIIAFRDHGLGSMPGTAAEILDDQVRKIICPEKINTAIWMEIISTAHRLGIPTTSTMLCGHIETPEQQLQHLFKVRSLQETAIINDYPAKITEFILLPFVGEQAPKPLRNRVGRDQPDLTATLVLTAVSRMVLGDVILNHQPSWVKLGLDGALEALQWGCNDIGGTLMEEHITTMAGAKGGTCLDVATIQKAITSIHRPYRQRNTLYQLL
ncbi:7,8-didemethyl-8-hydroxy-5-deazariboflavin synthase subunit CofH [Cyanobacterium stanieri LEGE 03274]|uniref:5-amino-6-(D-ribitylamino)uracil--L-tyrosine 4-hydroxyphenyl transferase n=1 Tax=Cyanobacterium stanieri LEGE 03274 TaxID=1828756 RepID=A0ABR9V719_9CHRO|nr:7,8-didemethyl-8-hydroxy-5-deazariboflavin synthase subunit CofH [Cyanobacterium stanieri]MBE9222634.1 7,8-didemethyl-8-hydroxy-5-deazariboflavin synthase subunit CofH [Cyanobacterium stanieri LEGE 03274]